MLGKLREKYQKAMHPVGKAVGRLGLSPNLTSMLSVVVAGLAGLFFFSHSLVWGTIFIALSGALDMIDGAVARATGKASRFGTVLDHVLDRYAEFLMMLGIIGGGYVGWYWGLFSLFGMAMASYTRAKAESVGVERCEVGLAERQEKLIILMMGAIGSVFYQGALELASIMVGVLSHITVVQRLTYARSKMRR
jgi:CDP-diacylglycerol--glycerol-3-phosphate 3-phosphatidyltransferase/archaetidylinositol phosphate synthase